MEAAVIDDLVCITLRNKFSVLIPRDSKGLFGKHVCVKLDIVH